MMFVGEVFSVFILAIAAIETALRYALYCHTIEQLIRISKLMLDLKNFSMQQHTC